MIPAQAITIDECRHGEFVISTDRARLDLDVIHEFLTKSYWAKGIPRETVARSIEHSLCFGVYDESGSQVGFARVISDFRGQRANCLKYDIGLTASQACRKR